MILWELFIGFLKVGLFSFGGAYAAIPLIRDVVLEYGWLTDDALTYMIAVAESTPGPIIVNLATYIGSNQAGLLGAAIATLTVILPAFVIILLVMVILRSVLHNRYVQAALDGLAPCVVGVVLATGATMLLGHLIPAGSVFPELRAVLVAAVLTAVLLGYKHITKKNLSPITLIGIAGVLGILVYGF